MTPKLHVRIRYHNCPPDVVRPEGISVRHGLVWYIWANPNQDPIPVWNITFCPFCGQRL